MSTPIAAEAAAATSRNGNGRRTPARGLIETAAAVVRELYSNPLIAMLDAEGLGAMLDSADREAVLTLVRSLEGQRGLPQRRASGTGQQDGQRI